MATCSVNKVWAPNGEESKLYEDAKKKLKSEQEALNLWAMTYTPEFQAMYGDWQSEDYEGKLDDNGEPKLADVMKPEYIKDADALEAAERSAQKYIQSSAKLESYKSKMHDTLVRKIAQLERSTGKGSATMSEGLKRLKGNLKALNWRSATQKFTATAAKQIDYATRRLEEELAKKEPNVALLTRYKNYVEAFDVLNTMSQEIKGNKMMSGHMTEELDQIAKLIQDKDAAKKQYRNYMETVVADKLASISTFEDRESITKLLNEAPFDIKGRERTMLYAGDSSDKVIQLMAKLINEQQQKTRRKSIEFTRVLAQKVDAVEKERSQFKKDPEKLYDPILERDSNGKLTGHIIHPKHNKPAYDAFVAANEGTALHEFLEYWVKEYDRLNDAIPASYRMANKLPTIMKSGWEKLTTSENKYGQIKESARKLFEKTNTDIATGEMTDDAGNVIHQIPVHFTQAYDSAVFNAEKRRLLSEGVGDSAAEVAARDYAISQLPVHLSYDLGASLQAFQHMAENYADMSEISDIADAAKDQLGERDVLKTTSDGSNIISKMKGLDNEKIPIKGTQSKSYQMMEALIETQIYGMTEKDIGSFSVFGTEVDSRKLAKLVAKYNSVNMLGGNMLAASANILMGETMQWAEAFGGEYYSRKDYLKAAKAYASEIPGIAADALERTPNSKVNLINEYYDVLGDYHPDGAGASDKSIIRKAVGGGALFFLNSSGEHMMQSRAMIATMMNREVYDSAGNSKGNLYDAHKAEDGKLVVPKDVYVKKDGKLVKFDKARKNDLSREIQYVLRKMHGNYNNQTSAEWQRNAVYGLVGQFRKWIADGMDRRYAKGDTSEFANKQIEGSYRSFGKFLAGLLNDTNQFNFEVGLSWNEMSDVQKANVRKTALELGVFTMASISLGLLGMAAKGWDEEKDKNKLAMMRYNMYLANRLSTEVASFANPMDAWQILKSPAASMSTIQSVAQTLNYALPWNWGEKYEAGVNKDKSKLLHNFTKLVPLWKQLDRISPDGLKGQAQYFNIN